MQCSQYLRRSCHFNPDIRFRIHVQRFHTFVRVFMISDSPTSCCQQPNEGDLKTRQSHLFSDHVCPFSPPHTWSYDVNNGVLPPPKSWYRVTRNQASATISTTHSRKKRRAHLKFKKFLQVGHSRSVDSCPRLMSNAECTPSTTYSLEPSGANAVGGS